MTTLERLRQLEQQATPQRILPVYRKTNTILAGAAAFTHARDIQEIMDALPALLDIAEAARRRAVTHALHVAAASAAASHDQQYLDVINEFFAALARLNNQTA